MGEVSYDQIQMYRERVRTIGVSLLGGNSGVEGPYELGIDSIYAVNEEDVPPDAAPSKWQATRALRRTFLTRCSPQSRSLRVGRNGSAQLYDIDPGGCTCIFIC